MPLATFTERRTRLRELMASNEITIPGSVFDATSARLAREAGYQMGLLGGSVASAVALGAPDIVLLTLSDFVEQARRITRASDLPMMVDADHGYGNAINVRRTVQDLEAAGVCAMSIEDTLLPRRFGGKDGELISHEEFAGKLHAAMDAKTDTSLVIVGRTAGLTAGGIDELVARVQICAKAGVDAVFATGVKSFDEVKAIAGACDVPLLVNALPAPDADLLAQRVRVVMQGHIPYYVALKALYDSFLFLRNGGTPEELRARALTPAEQAIALDEAGSKALMERYLM
jgi:carboxyvinyl-carboxyphosphonate phosphorylmutase